MSPSTRPSIWTKTPKSATRVTTPSTVSPGRNLSLNACQSLGWNSLIESEIRRFSWSIDVMIASMSSPFFRTSEGCLIRLVQDMSETWTSPSTPSSISTNAPKSVRLRTLPETRLPIEYLETTLSQGSGKVSFKDSEMRRASGLTSETTASTTSPGETTLEGFFTFFDQDISETCTRPSTPSW